MSFIEAGKASDQKCQDKGIMMLDRWSTGRITYVSWVENRFNILMPKVFYLEAVA